MSRADQFAAADRPCRAARGEFYARQAERNRPRWADRICRALESGEATFRGRCYRRRDGFGGPEMSRKGFLRPGGGGGSKLVRGTPVGLLYPPDGGGRGAIEAGSWYLDP